MSSKTQGAKSSSITHYKRPSTTKRNIKVDHFDLFESCARLRRIRDLLDDGTEHNLDSILCILGVDSNHSYAMRELANYLLFGFFDLREKEYEEEGYDDFVIEDAIFLIMKEVVHVYCNPINYRYFEPYISAWRGLRIWCLSDKSYEDEEISEDFKIKSFVEMTSRCRKIGVPFNHSGYSEKFDKMDIEKYPIIAAFAAEEYSGRGFFTLNFDINDISQPLHRAFSFVDPVNFTSRILTTTQQFENQWNAFFNHMLEETKNVTGLDEQKVFDPFKFYFDHGKLAYTNFTKLNRKEHPFVLFGSHSKKENFEKSHRGQTVDKVTLGTAGKTGKTAKHMVMQVIAPNSPLRCCRTFFFGYDHQVIIPDGEVKRSISFSLDMCALNKIYLIAVSVVKGAIDLYTETVSLEAANKFVLSKFPDALRRAEVNLPGKFVSYLSSKGCLEFSLKGYDLNGLPVTLEERRRPTCCVKCARIVLYDVPSVEYEDKILGTVAFSESFLDCHVTTVDTATGKLARTSSHVMLTEQIPPYYNWAVYKNDREINSHVDKFCHDLQSVDLGQLLLANAPGTLYSMTSGSSGVNVSCFGFEKGFIFTTKLNGSTVLPERFIQKILLVDPEDIKKKSVLSLTLDSEALEHLPANLADTSASHITVMLVFETRSKPFNNLYKDLVKIWESGKKFKRTSDVPEVLADFYSRVQSRKAKGAANEHLNDYKQDYESFICSLKLSSCQSVVAKKHLPIVTGESDDVGGFTQSCMVWITIVGGLPWSHREELARNVVEMTKSSFKWVVIKASDESDNFDVVNMQKNLTILVKEWKQESKGEDSQILRLMIVPPSSIELIHIVQGISSHPDKNAAQYLRISSVIYCIEQSRAFIKPYMTMPKLLDQCSQGLVSAIVLTGDPDASLAVRKKDDPKDRIQNLLRNVNNDVAFLLAPKGQISRTGDLETLLAPDFWDDPAMVQARYFLYPTWILGTFRTSPSDPFMYELSLNFKQALEKHRLLEVLKTMSEAEGNLYYMYGKFRVNRGNPQWVELTYWVPGKEPSIEPCGAPTPSSGGDSSLSFIRFYGHKLKEKLLKDYLRRCVPPKPQKKQLKTLETLTESEKKVVHSKRHLEKPPPGTFFNGTYFVSMDGEKSYTHPNMDQFLEDYVQSANKEIKAYNQKIDQQKWTDLFDLTL